LGEKKKTRGLKDLKRKGAVVSRDPERKKGSAI